MRLDQDLEKQKPCDDDATATMSDTSGSESDTSGSGSDTTSLSGKEAPPESSLSSERQDPTSTRFILASEMYFWRLTHVKRHMVRSKRAITKFFGSLEETSLNGPQELNSNSIADDYALNVHLKPPEFIENIWRSCNTGCCDGDADEMDDNDSYETDDEEKSPVPFNIPSKVPSSLKKSNPRPVKKLIQAPLPELVLLPCFTATNRRNSIPNAIFIASEEWEEDISIFTARGVREVDGFEDSNKAVMNPPS